MANDSVLSLKITADLNEAKAGISQLNAAIKDTSTITQDSNAKSAQSWKSVYEAQIEAMNRGHRAIDAEQKQTEAQEKASKAAEAHKKHIEKLRSELDSLLGSIDPAVKALGKLDEQERKLRESKKAGLIDTESYDSFMGKISEQRESLSNVDKLTTSTGKLSLNTRTARRDMASMIRQLVSGNFSSAGNNMFNLANTTGKFPPLFSAATLSLAAFTAAAFGLYKVISSILAEQALFNRALASTGNAAGTTTAQLSAMSSRIGKINSDYSGTKKVIADLASEGALSADSIENIATASAYMVGLTGKSADEAIASFAKIKDSVVDWALESNKQYHWLDIATFNRISALQAQGETEEAIAVATGKYAEVMKTRTEEMREQLNWLESGWESFKKTLSDIGEGLKTELKISLNLADINEQIEKLETAKSQGIYTFFGGSMDWNDSFEADLQALYAQRDAQQNLANIQREQILINDKAITASKELSERWKQNSTDLEKQALAIEDVRKQYEALWKTVDGRKSLQEKGVMSEDGKTFAGGQYDKDIKALTDSGLIQYNRELEKSLELQKEKTTLAKVEFEISSGQYKNASQQEKDKAIALAKQVDALKEKDRIEKQSAANAKQNLDLQNQLNQLLLGTKTNDTSVQQWYDNLHAQLTKAGNKQGLDLIDQLLPLKKAQANIDEITAKIQQAKANQTVKEQSIQAQVTSGMITQIEAQSQLVDLHKATASELANYIPELEKVANMPGDVGRAGQMALSQLKLEVAELEKTTDALTNALRNGLQNGIQSSLEGLALGTNNLSEALINLGQSVAKALATIASQGLAEMAMNGIDNLMSMAASLTANSGADAASNAIDTAATTAAATEMGTAITIAGSTASIELGTSINTAMITGTTTLSTALNTAFITGATTVATAITTAMAAGGASNAASGAVGAAFASGGYVRGPGTPTSDSIPARLSDKEFVVNAAAVKHVGVDYLHAINQRKIKPFASGGLVSNVAAPSAPNMSYAANSQPGGTTLAPVIQQTLVVDGGEVFTAGINSTQGKRQMMTFIKANNQTIRQTLGLD